jgi:hypothetical protein
MSDYINLLVRIAHNIYNHLLLSFTDSPVVTLELGSNLNGSSVREGMDVYFECNIQANPWVYKVIWRHNVSIYGKLFL